MSLFQLGALFVVAAELGKGRGGRSGLAPARALDVDVSPALMPVVVDVHRQTGHLPTSAGRTPEQQAKDDAHDIIVSGKRDWIDQTYAHASNGSLLSPVASTMNEWSLRHPMATEQELTLAFTGIIRSYPKSLWRGLSHHLTKDAVDYPELVQIVSILRDWQARLPGSKLRAGEAGIKVAHFQIA